MEATAEPEATDALQAHVEPAEDADEAKLATEIRDLWANHVRTETESRRTLEELRAQRLLLGEKLACMKSRLARPGRSGAWAGFLKTNGWPRATADRLVQRYRRSLTPEEKRLTEAVSVIPAEEASALVQRLIPRLKKVLTTRPAVERFFCELKAAFPPDGFGSAEAA